MIEFVTGSALGVFVGLLVGFSTEQLAGTVLAGILALLAAFFGLRDSKDAAPQAGSAPRLARIAGFAAMGSVALLGGVWLRTHDTLGLDPAQRRQAWIAAGIGPDAASRLAVFEALGLNLTGATVASTTPAGRGVLFASPADDCTDLDLAYDSPEERRRAFARIKRWRMLADALQGVDPAKQAGVMQAVVQAVCNQPAD